MKVVVIRRIAWGALWVAVAASSAGCGGFNGSYSASPASLFLQNRPAMKSSPLVPPTGDQGQASVSPATSSASWARTVTMD